MVREWDGKGNRVSTCTTRATTITHSLSRPVMSGCPCLNASTTKGGMAGVEDDARTSPPVVVEYNGVMWWCGVWCDVLWRDVVWYDMTPHDLVGDGTIECRIVEISIEGQRRAEMDHSRVKFSSAVCTAERSILFLCAVAHCINVIPLRAILSGTEFRWEIHQNTVPLRMALIIMWKQKSKIDG